MWLVEAILPMHALDLSSQKWLSLFQEGPAKQLWIWTSYSNLQSQSSALLNLDLTERKDGKNLTTIPLFTIIAANTIVIVVIPSEGPGSTL